MLTHKTQEDLYPIADVLEWKKDLQERICQDTKRMTSDEYLEYLRKGSEEFRNEQRLRRQALSVQRTGAALIVCIVLLTLLGTLTGVLVKNALDDRRLARLALIEAQLEILLQDGQDRAVKQREAKPDFSGETLEILSEDTNPRGIFRLTSQYIEKTKKFDMKADFIDRNGTVLMAKER